MDNRAGNEHEKRFHAPGDRLRLPERLALLEVARVVELCRAGVVITSALDVGTGTGVFAEAFAAAGLAVAGIDPRDDMLAVAREHVPTAWFKPGVAEDIPFADGSYDLVFLGHVLHETDDPMRALAEARRVSRTRVAILEWPYIHEDRGPRFDHRMDPARLASLAGEAGFSRVEPQALSHMILTLLTP
jgi:SAM-dependent methyltransferase